MIREDRDKRILEAVRCFMRGEKADWAAQETCDESAVAPKDAAGGVWEEWRDFINLCVKHQVLPMVYEAILWHRSISEPSPGQAADDSSKGLSRCHDSGQKDRRVSGAV